MLPPELASVVFARTIKFSIIRYCTSIMISPSTHNHRAFERFWRALVLLIIAINGKACKRFNRFPKGNSVLNPFSELYDVFLEKRIKLIVVERCTDTL